MKSEERYFVIARRKAWIFQFFASAKLRFFVTEAMSWYNSLEDARDLALKIRAEGFTDVPKKIRDGELAVIDSKRKTILIIREACYAE